MEAPFLENNWYYIIAESSFLVLIFVIMLWRDTFPNYKILDTRISFQRVAHFGKLRNYRSVKAAPQLDGSSL